jgi:hypothetical protein
MINSTDSQREREQPKDDLGYLKRKKWFSEFLPRIRDEKRSPLDRLEDIEALLRAAQLYEERFAVEIAELTTMRNELKRLLNVL